MNDDYNAQCFYFVVAVVVIDLIAITTNMDVNESNVREYFMLRICYENGMYNRWGEKWGGGWIQGRLN